MFVAHSEASVHVLRQHTAAPCDCEQLPSFAQIAPSGCVPVAAPPLAEPPAAAPPEFAPPPRAFAPPPRAFAPPPCAFAPPPRAFAPPPCAFAVPPVAALPPLPLVAPPVPSEMSCPPLPLSDPESSEPQAATGAAINATKYHFAAVTLGKWALAPVLTNNAARSAHAARRASAHVRRKPTSRSARARNLIL